MKIKTIVKSFIIATAFLAPVESNAQLDLGKLISAGAQTIQNATATTNFNVKDLVGTWKYSSPAISFKGNNTLSNLGGAAASTAVENKLSPIYQKAGLQKSTLTVNDDLTFSFNFGKTTLTGTIEKSGESLAFNFSAFGKVPIGKIDCMATKSGNTLNLTFDTSKLLAAAQKISSISSSSAFSSLNSILSNYKDMYVGMKMTR